MKAAVIGLGSMGKRRLRLLQKYVKTESCDETKWTVIGIDSNCDRCKEAEVLFQIETFSSLEDAEKNDNIDCAVISTSPHTHATIINECLQRDIHVFTEINLLSDGYEENIALAKEKNLVLFLSSTFMYRKEIEYIKKKVHQEQFRGMYRYHIGQYLPEWHPWENYQNFFVGRKDTNGCREIFAIELPWLVGTFGEITEIHSVHKKISDLEIDYDDSYEVQIEHKNGVIGSLVVDIVTPKAGRNFELWSEGFYIGWDGTPDSLVEYNKISGKIESVSLYSEVEHQEGYHQFVVENAYYDEIVNFINCIKVGAHARHDFVKDAKILFWIDEIES